MRAASAAVAVAVLVSGCAGMWRPEGNGGWSPSRRTEELERRDDSEEDPGDQGQGAEKEHDAQVDADGCLGRQEKWRQLRQDGAVHHDAKRQSDNTAEDGKHETLGEQLADQA